MRIQLIINPRDDASMTALRASVEALRAEGHEVSARITFEAGDAKRYAAEAVSESPDLLLTAGGDGTLFEVANGLLGSGQGAADELPGLGIVPLGTANDLANGLFYPPTVSEAVRFAVDSPLRRVDVATVNDRFFLNVSTGGFGAEATDEAPERAKRSIGILAYLAQGVRTFAAFEPLTARFTSGDEVIHDGEFLLFGVGNGGRTGGGNWITPKADMTDGLLDLCIVLPMGRADFLRLAPDLRAGEHVGNENVIYRQVPQLLIEGGDEMRVNADGESVDARRLHYGIRPSALRMPIPGEEP